MARQVVVLSHQRMDAQKAMQLSIMNQKKECIEENLLLLLRNRRRNRRRNCGESVLGNATPVAGLTICPAIVKNMNNLQVMVEKKDTDAPSFYISRFLHNTGFGYFFTFHMLCFL